MTIPRLRMVHGLFAALAVGAAFAAYESASSPTAAAAPAASIAPIATSMNQGRVEEASGAVEGDVIEVLDVPQYTYARLGEKGSEGTWTAFSSTKIEVGQHLKLVDAVLMTDFTSKVLKRTFPAIWFGNLGGGAPPADNPHGRMSGSFAPSAVSPSVEAKATVVQMHPVEKAPGVLGETVAEILSGRSNLAGKKVRVRAIVVKSTTSVLGHDYLHVRDGTGDEGSHTNDLSVATDSPAALGDTLLLEGTLVLDADIGSGYTFPTLLKDARIVAP